MDRVTIYDIAREAGVSVATVSRVINDYPHVNPEKRRRVREILERYDYIPNETARNLVNRNTGMVGILIADMRTAHHTEGVYYVQNEFVRNGYSCLIYNTSDDPGEQAKCIADLSRRKIEAVVMMGSIYQNRSVEEAIRRYIPTVPVAITNGSMDLPNVYGVLTDDRAGVLSAVEHLSVKGRRNLVFITDRITPSNSRKIEGYEEGCRRIKGISGHPVVNMAEEKCSVEEKVSELIEGDSTIDAFLFSEDYLAFQGMHALLEKGIRIPGDVAVTGMNNSKYSPYSNPSLTSVDNRLPDATVLAVRTLLSVIRGEKMEKDVMLPCSLVLRSST